MFETGGPEVLLVNPVMAGMAIKGILFFLKMMHFTYQLLFYISALKVFW